MQKIQHYGIKEFAKTESAIDNYVEDIKINGFTILSDVVSRDLLPTIRDKVDQVYETQASEIEYCGDLADINDANIGRALLAYDEIFLNLATQPIFLDLVKRLLGDYFILQMQNAIINLPNQNNYQISWHRDLNYQHFTSSRPLAISILVCIDDFSLETGGTCVLPSSHKIEAFPSEQFIKNNEKNIIAKAGSALVMDSMLFHRAGYNSSVNVRRGINHMYCLPIIKQQISFPAMLNGKYADDAFLNKFLGYDSETGRSVTEWRARKFEKNKL